MMNTMANFTKGWMDGGAWIWMAACVLAAVLLIVMIARQFKK